MELIKIITFCLSASVPLPVSRKSSIVHVSADNITVVKSQLVFGLSCFSFQMDLSTGKAWLAFLILALASVEIKLPRYVALQAVCEVVNFLQSVTLTMVMGYASCSCSSTCGAILVASSSIVYFMSLGLLDSKPMSYA